MAYLDAKKVLAFVDEIYAEEAALGPVDPQAAMFKAVIRWDERLRADFTTGMTQEQEPLTEPDGSSPAAKGQTSR